MQIVTVDIMGPLPMTTEEINWYVLVAVHYFMRWIEAYGTPNHEATTVAKKLVDEVFCCFSPPNNCIQIRQDNLNQSWYKSCENCFRYSKHTWVHNTIDCSTTERYWMCYPLQWVTTVVWVTVGDHPSVWDQNIGKCVCQCMAYNSSVHSSTIFPHVWTICLTASWPDVRYQLPTYVRYPWVCQVTAAHLARSPLG